MTFSNDILNYSQVYTNKNVDDGEIILLLCKKPGCSGMFQSATLVMSTLV